MMADWIEFLQTQGGRFDNSHITFSHDAAAEAATSACCLMPLTQLAAIRSDGEESAVFLQNMLSNDVLKLPDNQAQWSSFNTAKGRVLSTFILWRSDSGHRLLTARDLQVDIAKKMSMYILRTKTRLSCDDECVLLGISGPAATTVLRQTGFEATQTPMRLISVPQHHSDYLQLTETLAIIAVSKTHAATLFTQLRDAGATPTNSDQWTLEMILAGLPLISRASQDAFVAQMLNFDLINGISFKKGCYPGQEIIARTKYLGKIKRRLYRISRPATEQSDMPVIGTALFSPSFGSQAAGQIVMAARTANGDLEALAVLRTDALTGNDLCLDPAHPQPAFRLSTFAYMDSE